MPPHIHSIALPRHAPDDLKVWLIEIDLTAPLDLASAGVLNSDELARAKRFLRHADTARFATVRAAMRQILAAQMNVNAASLVIKANQNGRPQLELPNAPDFNVSHSGTYGMIALSTKRRVGIDIEEARTSLHWRELEPAVFADADARALAALADNQQRQAFFDCWTAKEAVLKAHGTGMGAGAIGMTTFSVLPRDGDQYALSPEAGAFALASLETPENYHAAIAWQI
jgi:4'-phosphopantetheinyl transferase